MQPEKLEFSTLLQSVFLSSVPVAPHHLGTRHPEDQLNPTRRALIALATVTFALAGSACGSEDPTVTTVDPNNVSPQKLTAPPKVANAAGAREDVVMDGCPVTGATARATGSVTNSTKATTDYAITISWVNERSDVMARAVAVVRGLGAGEKRTWKASAPAGKADADNCTVFAQRGTVRGDG